MNFHYDYDVSFLEDDEELVLQALRELSTKEGLDGIPNDMKERITNIMDAETSEEESPEDVLPPHVMAYVRKNSPWVNLNNQIHKEVVLEQWELAKAGRLHPSEDGCEVYQVDSRGERINTLMTKKGLQMMQMGREESKGESEDTRIKRDLDFLKQCHDAQTEFPDVSIISSQASDKQAFYLKKKVEERWPGKPPVRIKLEKCHKSMMSDIIDYLAVGAQGFKHWEDYVRFLAKNGILKVLDFH